MEETNMTTTTPNTTPFLAQNHKDSHNKATMIPNTMTAHTNDPMSSMTSSLPISETGRVTFPIKLHRILCDESNAAVISWLEHGKAWKVHNPERFEAEIIPSNFKLTKLSSFTRQVNGWGFRRITKGADKGGFFHELFVRDAPEYCTRMRRLKKKDGVDPFYAIRDHEADLRIEKNLSSDAVSVQNASPTLITTQSPMMRGSSYAVKRLLEASSSAPLPSSGLQDIVRNSLLSTSWHANQNRFAVSPQINMNLNNTTVMNLTSSDIALLLQAQRIKEQQDVLEQRATALKTELLLQAIRNGSSIRSNNLIPNQISSSRMNLPSLSQQNIIDRLILEQQQRNIWNQTFTR